MPLQRSHILIHIVLLIVLLDLVANPCARAQINTDRVCDLGCNALYSDDYFLSIQYFNQVIIQKPYLAKPYYFRGLAKVELGDLMGGEEDLNRCLEINPFVEDAYRIRAIARNNLGKLEQALNDYNKYLAFRADDRMTAVYKAMCLMEMDYYPEAENCLNTVIDVDPNNWKACLAMSVNKFHSGDYSSSLEYLSRAISLNSSDVKMRLMRCGIYIDKMRDYDAALEDMDEVISIEPMTPSYYIGRAILRYKSGHKLEALSDFDYAIALDQNNLKARCARAALNEELGNMHAANDDHDYVKSHGYDYSGQHIKPLEDLTMLDLDSDILSLSRVNSEFFTTQPLLPGHRYREPLRQNPVSYESIEPLGLFMLSYYNNDDKLSQRGYFSRELNELNETHGLPHDLTLDNKMYRLTAYDASDRFSSLENYNALMQDSVSMSAINFMGRALDYMLLRNVDASIDDATMSITLSPQFSLAYFLRSNACWMKFEIEQAQVAGDDNWSDKPNAPEFSNVKQRALINDMLSDLKYVLKLSPSFTYAYYNLAFLQALTKDYATAIDNYTHAIELKPDLGEAYFNRGIAYMKLGDKVKATADFSKAGELGIMISYTALKLLGN